MLLERQPSTGLCGQKIGGQLGCMLPGEHEGPHDIGGALRRRSPVLKPVETASPRPAAPPAPKSKAVPAKPGPRPGSWAVAAGELAWAKIKGYPWWPARVKQQGQQCPPWQCPSSAPVPPAHLAALGSSALPGRGRPTERPATASGARAGRLQSRRFRHHL
eukprot:scaffold3725_cov48-Phaeocystis_antarctica.AAC.5